MRVLLVAVVLAWGIAAGLGVVAFSGFLPAGDAGPTGQTGIPGESVKGEQGDPGVIGAKGPTGNAGANAAKPVDPCSLPNLCGDNGEGMMCNPDTGQSYIPDDPRQYCDSNGHLTSVPTAGYQCRVGDETRFQVCAGHKQWVDEQVEYMNCLNNGGTWDVVNQRCKG